MKDITTIGIDIAKNIFQLHGVDRHGKTSLIKTVTRAKFLETLASMPPCLIGIEACGGAHHWARKITQMGHTVRMIAPQFVVPYRKSGKNDANDAEAICEAGPAAGPIVLVGAVIHKLPEGMVALSLMRDFPRRVKATGTLLLAGIIPLGAVITIPERIQQPLLAIAAGGAFPGTIQGTGACRFRRNPPDGHRRYPGRREGRGRDDCGHGPRRTVLPDDGMTARAAPGSAAQPHARRTRDRSRYGRSIFPRFSAAQRAYPESRKDAVTSRPSLLLAIGRSTKHAGQTRL